ncbi:hypothetical protein FRC10_011010 [Ceratobasidium sp. 414]|nr:hypothetical protein FRC10_011010 [Ceratobasidium sp. 414]
MENFDLVSDQIIEGANRSDGSTLMQVVKLIFEKAKDKEAFSKMYALLCRKMVERVSPNVQDETIRNAEGQPIRGGLLFRKYLLNRCQEDFERGWSAKEAAAALAASQANGEAVLYSEEYYAAAKAKRQGLGLVRFIGELFKLQMLTERIMHECIKKLLLNVINPEEEEIESLCKLLTTVGHSLDNARARNHMDIYFERMQEMARGNNMNPRTQLVLQDVIELRQRHWQARSVIAQPSTLAAVHEQAKRDEAASRNAILRGGSRRGEHHNGHGQQADGWNVAGGTSAARPPAKASDLSQFGKISKPTGLSFGQTSVFNKDPKQRDASLSRASSNVDMFAALGAAGADGPPQPETAARGGASSRKPSMDLGSGGAPAVEGGSVRRRLKLLPRTKPTETEADKGEDEATPEPAAAPALMSEVDAQKEVKEGIKEYMGMENVEEATLALETLPTEYRIFNPDTDIYSGRMQEMLGGSLNDAVALRQRYWQARPGVGPPSASASVSERNNAQSSGGTVVAKSETSTTGGAEDSETAPEPTVTETCEEAMETRVERCIRALLFIARQLCLDTEDVEQAIDTCQNLQGERRHLFVEKSIAAMFDGGAQSVNIIEKLFAAAQTRRVCSPKIFERGFLSAVESAAETSVDFPRAYEWLARLIYAAGLTKARVERMAERISVVGEPRVQPKYLLAYEFDKMIA